MSGYVRPTVPTARSLSGANVDVAAGEAAPTYATPDNQAGQGAIEEVQDNGAVRVHVDGKIRAVTAGAPGAAVARVANSDGQTNLQGSNAGVVMPYDDTPGRFSEPGKA